MDRSKAARASYTVAFGSAPRLSEPDSDARMPRVARLLALAHRIDQMVKTGELRDLAEAGQAMGITRARLTQITNLMTLAPEIQEAVLDLPMVTSRRESITERSLRPISAESVWQKQIHKWRQTNE